MLTFVGLGLCDEQDITLKGLSAVKAASHVFLEAYTSILLVEKGNLERLYGKEVQIMDRDAVEQHCDQMLVLAKTENVAFLVVGDAFCATTHTDLYKRATDLDVEVRVVHNASIMNACGQCGLSLYRMGETISLVFFEKDWKPDSFYDKVKSNMAAGLHTLCLLDIKVKERSLENLMRGRDVFEPPRYMSVTDALEQMLEIEATRHEGVFSTETQVFGLARIGHDDAMIRAGSIKELLEVDFGKPLHTLVVCAPELKNMESEMFQFWS